MVISDFSSTKLRRLDLTLLLAFLGLLRHRKAADVAIDLGLTQSAISQALKRLREIFGDDLFVRRPHGMEQTTIAMALEVPVTRAAEALRGALGAARAFDPATVEDIIRIAALDAEQSVLIPPLAARLRVNAPGLRMLVLPLGRSAAVEALVEGRLDLALGFIWERPETILTELIYEESFLVAGRSNALPLAPALDLDAYCDADHVLVSPAGDLRGVIDDRLEAMGRSRRIILGLPTFLPALAAVAESRALVTIPLRIARRFAKSFGLTMAQPPVEIRSFSVSAFWHRRNDSDSRTAWLRSQLAACISQ